LVSEQISALNFRESGVDESVDNLRSQPSREP
jgi:hypothetical protein